MARCRQPEMHATDFTPVLTRLRSPAEGGLSESAEERKAREAEEAARCRYCYAQETCTGLAPDRAPGGGRERGGEEPSAALAGELGGLVLSYLCKHPRKRPLIGTAITKGLGGRSTGASRTALERM